MYRKTLITVVLFLALAPLSARAACTSPAGVTAEIVYNASESVLQYCDGGQWIAMGPVTPGPGGNCANPAAAPGTVVYNADYDVPQFCNGGEWVAMGPVPGAGGAGCTSPAGPPGMMIYNNDAGDMQYCDGTDWIALRGFHSASGAVCDDPDPFDFTDETGVEAGTLTASGDILQISSIECAANVSISGEGGPEFRICTDGSSEANCDGSEVVTWGSAAQQISAGEYLQLRLTSDPELGGKTRTATVLAGQKSDDWAVTTRACDDTPDAFAFTDAGDVSLSTVTASDIVQITGIDTVALGCGASVTLSGDASAEYRICDDGTCSAGPAWGTGGQTIDNNQYLQARVTSSSANNDSVNATLDVGGVADTFTATTCGDPGAFSFTDDTEQPLSTTVESDIVAITGTAGCDYNVTLSGDASAEYRICNDGTCSGAPAWGSGAGVVAEGQYLQARVTTSGTKGATVSATLDVGATPVSDTYSATTKDDDPDAFNFTDNGSAPLSSTVTSDIVQITGITTNIATSISGDGTPEYRICDSSDCSSVVQTWTTGSSAIDNNEYLQLRLTTPGTYSTLSTATMTVGLGSDAWNVTTKQAPKRVFVTAAGTYDGAFGGTGTADTDCQSAADTQALGGTWKAWLSDSTTDASARVTQYSGDYELLDGTVVANGWSDLTDGSLDAAINRDETNSLQSGVTVYTGTGSGGAKVSATASDHCDDWTYNGNQGSRGGTYGSTSSTNSGWTNSGSNKCSNTRHLYCFEQ